MSETRDDRAPAIRVLEEMGFIARARDWVMGRTIMVTRGPSEPGPGDLQIYRSMAYLRFDAGAWVVDDLANDERRFDTLEEAAGHLHDVFARQRRPAAPSPEGEAVARRILWAMENVLPWYAPQPRPGRHVLRCPKELEDLWRIHGGRPEAVPQVDFTRSIVIGIFAAPGRYRSVECVGAIEPLEDGPARAAEDPQVPVRGREPGKRDRRCPRGRPGRLRVRALT